MAAPIAEFSAYAGGCLLLRLMRHSDRVVWVDGELVDAAGRVPRRDRSCIVTVKRLELPSTTAADIHLAIERAADRADCAGRLGKGHLRHTGSPQVPQTEEVGA